jgi:TonB-dependent receptor
MYGETVPSSCLGLILRRQIGGCLLALAGALTCVVAFASTPELITEYQLESKNLGDALNEFALQSDVEILFNESEVAGKRSNAVVGRYQAEQALLALLDGSGMGFSVAQMGTFLVETIPNGEGESTMNRKNRGRSLMVGIAAATAVATASVNAEELQADGSEAGLIEETIVYGIRGSLQKSLDRKRDADHLVDAITSEDIGAFPDQNLAEAMARISGVAIDRKEGEGAFVSVRGLGPQYVQATTDGRVMTSNVNPGGLGEFGNTTANAGSRAVGFNQLQAGLVQAVEVYKSPRADHVEGGLGGVVEIKTRRPLDIGKQQIAISGSLTSIDLSDDNAPGLFGLYSNTNADQTVGFMVSVDWDERENRADAVRTSGGYQASPVSLTVDGNDIEAYFGNGFIAGLRETERERLNISTALQFRPNDRLEVTLDGLVTDNQLDVDDYWYAAYRTSGGLANNLTGATVVDNGSAKVLSAYSTTNANSFTQTANEIFDSELTSLGANIRFQATDRLSLDFDLSVSDVESTNSYREFLTRYTGLQADVSYVNRIPSLRSSDNWSDPDDYTAVKFGRQAHQIKDKENQYRIDATYELNSAFFESVKFGVRDSSRDRADWQRAIVVRTKPLPIADFGGGIALPASDFLDGINHDLPFSSNGTLVIGDLEAADTVVREQQDTVARRVACWSNPTDCSIDGFSQDGEYGGNIDQTEDTFALYAMVSFQGDFAGAPYTGNLGVRRVETDVSVSGIVVDVIGVDNSDPTQPQPIRAPGALVDLAHDYSEVLPSLNLTFELRDDLLLRAAVGKVMSRASFQDVNPNSSFAAAVGEFRGGNPYLNPIVAWQYDLALEWYFAEYSILSFGLFHKDVEDFIQDQRGTRTIATVTDDSGQPAQFAEYIPQNADEAEITGFEMSYQQTFSQLPAPFDGLGVVANYTYIDSDSEFEHQGTGATFGVPGLSEDSMNLSVFYEKESWTARLAYNRRGEYLDQVNGYGGGHPLFVDDYSQLDASLGYRFSDNVSVGLEAINITDETNDTYVLLGTGPIQWFDSSIHTGPRYQINVRMKF